MGFLTTPLDAVLGSTSKVRLLRLLVQQDRTVSAREAARITGTSKTAILAAIEDLTQLGIVEREESGRQFLCRANRGHWLLQGALQPLFTAEAEWTDRFFQTVRQTLASAGVVAAWVFGSVAQGRDKPGSDLDLFLLTATDKEADHVLDRLSDILPRWRQEFGADVRPVVMSQRRAVTRRRAGDPFVANAVQDARLIVGAIPKELHRGQADNNTPRR